MTIFVSVPAARVLPSGENDKLLILESSVPFQIGSKVSIRYKITPDVQATARVCPLGAMAISSIEPLPSRMRAPSGSGPLHKDKLEIGFGISVGLSVGVEVGFSVGVADGSGVSVSAGNPV